MRSYGRHTGRGTATAYPVACAVCGVTWSRRQMRYDGSGQLVCPDDYGRDAVTLDRLNARVRPLRQKGPSDGLQTPTLDDPRRILGTNLYAWTRAELGEFVESNSLVTRIINLGGTGDLYSDIRGATWRPSGLSGRPAFVGGAGNWRFFTRNATPLPQGRPYLWCVAALSEATSGTRMLVGTFNSDLTLSPMRLFASGGSFLASIRSDGSGVEAVTGPAVDTNIHLFEIGFAADGVGRFVVDGTQYNGAHTAQSVVTATRIALGTGTVAWPGPFSEIVLSYDDPSAANKARMRDYFSARYSDLELA